MLHGRTLLVLAWLTASLAACGMPTSTAPVPVIEAAVLLRPGQREAPLIDVRGPTERGRDGISATPHHWITYGQDRGGAPVTELDGQNFLRQIRATIGAPPAAVVVFCSTGVRSARAAAALELAGYAATSVCDGWLGNHTGAGLRAAEAPAAR